jgi:hypothetical protein
VPRALAWRSSLSPRALSRHVYIRDTSCKQITLIALHKAITTVDRTIHISLCTATFSHCVHCNNKPMASFSKRLAWSCHGGLVLLPFFFSKNTKSNSTLSCSLQKIHNACCMSVCAFGDSKGFLGDQMCVAVTKSTENTRMDLGSVPLVTSLKQKEQDRMFPLAG